MVVAVYSVQAQPPPPPRAYTHTHTHTCMHARTHTQVTTHTSVHVRTHTDTHTIRKLGELEAQYLVMLADKFPWPCKVAYVFSAPNALSVSEGDTKSCLVVQLLFR